MDIDSLLLNSGKKHTKRRVLKVYVRKILWVLSNEANLQRKTTENQIVV